MAVTINGSTGIAGVDGSAGTPSMQGADTNTGMFFPAADTIAFAEGGAEVMRIDSSGNVGIGTSSPTAYGTYKTLEVRGTGGGLVQFGTDATNAAYLYATGGNSGFTNIANGVMTFATNNTERARIDSSGNLLVGKTTTAETTVGVCFSSSVNNIGLSSGNYFIVNYVPGGSSTMIDFRTGGVSKGSISQNGSNVAYNTSSDYRLKTDIQPMTSGLTTVSALKPVIYKWKEDGSQSEGFIAHELQAVIPHAVTGEKDATNEDGSIKPQGVDYSKIVVHLVAAIQELKAQNDELKARLEALEAK
jgi:hypothetical protein